MTGFAASLRQTRGLMVALFAVLFLAGPLLDSVECAADGIAFASASVQARAAVAGDAGHDLLGHADDSQGVCQHGHVHSAPALTEIQAGCAAPAAAYSAIPRPEASPLPSSIGGPGLDRPPRA